MSKQDSVPGRMKMEILHSLMSYVRADVMKGALTCARRLMTSLPHKELNNNRVLVAYGGGKDSSYMVAFVRLIQLLLFQDHGTTFQLCIATNRHSGMPRAVMENIDRTYHALDLYNDPDVELLLIDGSNINIFEHTLPLSQNIIERNRLDILMTGHRCNGEARPTFCNACNLSMVNSFGIAMSYGNGVDVVITGDSRKEQIAYYAWVRQVATQFGLSRYHADQGICTFLRTLDEVSLHYFSDIYGANNDQVQSRRIEVESIPREPFFFSIYSDTEYEAEDHWNLLTHFLGFQFDDIAFSFTESDCANPALMAHLRGLKAEHLYQRTYEEGIAEYVHFAIRLMHRKHFPAHLIEVMEARYNSSEAVNAMREKLKCYAEDVLHLTEEQLVCMLYSPFVQKGKHLTTYLAREQPDLYNQSEQIHRLLTSADVLQINEEQHQLEERLQRISHLAIGYLQTLYNTNIALNTEESARNNPIAIVLAKDPHKAIIKTLHSPDGPVIDELITGR